MASVVLSGDTSGSVSLTVPAVAGTNTATIPASTGNVLLDSTVGVCRAWVNFNGTGTVAISASFNVSSITDNGTGDYTVNFATALSDANYAPNVNAGSVSTGSRADAVSGVNQSDYTMSTSAYRFYTSYVNSGASARFDPFFVAATFFGN